MTPNLQIKVQLTNPCQKEPLSKWSKSWGRAHVKASAKAELPVGCREPAGRDQGAATQASPPSSSHGPFCWKETFIYPDIFQLKPRPPFPTFPSSELTSLIFLFSVCPPDSFRLFEWKFLMQMCPATHFPVLCFVKYLNWPVVWVYNLYTNIPSYLPLFDMELLTAKQQTHLAL